MNDLQENLGAKLPTLQDGTNCQGTSDVIEDGSTNVHTSCFNMGVRMLAYNEYKVVKYSKSVMPTHFIDLRFCVSFLSALR